MPPTEHGPVSSPYQTLLLDVNALLALGFVQHPFHRVIVSRLERALPFWATCELTQLGFIRIAAAPSFEPGTMLPGQARALLLGLTQDTQHQFLRSTQAPAELESFASLRGHKQVADAWILSVAVSHGATLLSFDGPLKRLGGEHVELLSLSA